VVKGRRGVFTCVGWQVTLCGAIWQVTRSRTLLRTVLYSTVLVGRGLSRRRSASLMVWNSHWRSRTTSGVSWISSVRTLNVNWMNWTARFTDYRPPTQTYRGTQNTSTKRRRIWSKNKRGRTKTVNDGRWDWHFGHYYIISYVVDVKRQNRLKAKTDKPKLKVKMQSVSDDDVRKKTSWNATFWAGGERYIQTGKMLHLLTGRSGTLGQRYQESTATDGWSLDWWHQTHRWKNLAISLQVSGLKICNKCFQISLPNTGSYHQF